MTIKVECYCHNMGDQEGNKSVSAYGYPASSGVIKYEFSYTYTYRTTQLRGGSAGKAGKLILAGHQCNVTTHAGMP